MPDFWLPHLPQLPVTCGQYQYQRWGTLARCPDCVQLNKFINSAAAAEHWAAAVPAQLHLVSFLGCGPGDGNPRHNSFSQILILLQPQPPPTCAVGTSNVKISWTRSPGTQQMNNLFTRNRWRLAPEVAILSSLQTETHLLYTCTSGLRGWAGDCSGWNVECLRCLDSNGVNQDRDTSSGYVRRRQVGHHQQDQAWAGGDHGQCVGWPPWQLSARGRGRRPMECGGGPCESGISPATDGNIPTQAPYLAAAKEEGKGLSSCVHWVLLKLKD